MEDSNKRILILVAVSVVLLLVYPYVLNKLYPQKEVKKQAAKEAPVAAVKEKRPSPALKDKAPAAPVLPVEEELITVETPLYKAVLTTYGGGVRSWELKRYRKTRKKDSPLIDVAKPLNGLTPLASRLEAEGLPEMAVFTPSAKSLSLDKGERKRLTLTWTAPNGMKTVKTYLFSGDNYTVKSEVKVINGSNGPVEGFIKTDVTWAYARAAKKKKSGAYAYHEGPVIMVKGKVKRQPLEAGREEGSEDISWIGLEDKYFISAILPERDTGNLLWESTVTTLDKKNAARVSVGIPFDLGPGDEALLGYRAYLGPKEYKLLKAEGWRFEEAIEFGFFSFIAKPLLVVLNFFQRFVVNYGIAIILLTIVIKIAFYPLTKHSLTSMKEMQKIQPQLLAIKEKYKKNKEKMNKEMMELYRRHKINPLGGCLPMILQIPVFIGLYEVLAVAIELRHAPFALWIQDLSAKDPYYVTPLLMGASMFIQQKMTPTAMDPTQAKMMLFMPVLMTFLFLNFPSGLVLYWLVNNILSIMQQYQIHRTGSGGSGAAAGPSKPARSSRRKPAKA